MTYKEFKKWCNKRACDGYWSIATADFCIAIMDMINTEPFWKREKEWQNVYKDIVIKSVIEPIEKKINELISDTKVKGSDE